MTRKIEMQANVILTFDAKDQMIYDAPFTMELPGADEALDADEMEVDVIRQILAPVPNADLQDLVKISLCYSMDAREDGSQVDVDGDREVCKAMHHLIRHNAKYYFQPNQRDDYEQRLVDALRIASQTQMFV